MPFFALCFQPPKGFKLPFDGKADKNGVVAGAGVGLILDYDDYSIEEIVQMAASEPFVIAGVRYDYSDNAQRKQKWEARYKNGVSITSTPLRLRKNLSDSIDGELEDPNFTLLVDRGTTLFIGIAPAPSATISRLVQVSFKIGSSFDNTNPLKGRSPIKKHGAQFAANQNVRVF